MRSASYQPTASRMTSGWNCRHLKRPETEGVSRSIGPAYQIRPPKLQHFLIECMVAQSPEQTFKARLARFNSYIKAAHCLTTFEIQYYGTDEFVTEFDAERSKFWLNDSRGAEVLISDSFNTAGPKRVFKCVPRSPIARCVQELWSAEMDRAGN